MHGWKGTILTIDLSSGSTAELHPPLEVYRTYIGGKGLAGYYLRPCVTEPWNSPALPLLFFTGPLVNTLAPTSGRMTIMSRSPLTGTVGDTSVGGRLGTEIKKAGYDGIIIRGRSSGWCGITITGKTVSIVDASGMTGLETGETIRRVGAKGSMAVIGPAAENGVLFAGIAVDGHFFSGRSGLGLVMAEKKVKYLAVSGDEKTDIFDPSELKKAREEILRLVSASPVLKGELGLSEFGTGVLYDLMRSRRMMPTGNFRKTYFPEADRMNAWHYKTRYGTEKSGCPGCTILCKKKGKDGSVMPEFETMSHFSALLENSDLDMVVEANRLCNELGMDTISAAAVLACHAEIEGRKLGPGEILSLLRDIAFSRSPGDLLKVGSRRYAESRGRPESSMSVKGLDLPAYDPRGAYGMALGYATSTRGGCHLRSYPISHEILRKPVATDRFDFSGKARIIKIAEDMNAAVDSLTACRFIFFAATLEEYARAYYGVTGVESSAQDLLKIGERIFYNERIMNALNGFTRDDDDLPVRFFTEPGSGGDGIDVPPIGRADFLKARQNYYAVRGLDDNGMPTESRCRDLGLEWEGR